MIDSYWDLYVAYIAKCVRDNRINDIDPHHYEMEWNHFLPKSIFGDWPIGHYLTLRQHAIASALQTLAFKKNCMFGWHKHYLPESLCLLAWASYPEFCRGAGLKSKKLKVGIHDLNRNGRLADNARGGRKGGRVMGMQHAERGTGVCGQPLEKLQENARTTNAQVWESTVDGFRSNAGNVSQHNRANGWDPKARIRVK